MICKVTYAQVGHRVGHHQKKTVKQLLVFSLKLKAHAIIKMGLDQMIRRGLVALAQPYWLVVHGNVATILLSNVSVAVKHGQLSTHWLNIKGNKQTMSVDTA